MEEILISLPFYIHRDSSLKVKKGVYSRIVWASRIVHHIWEKILLRHCWILMFSRIKNFNKKREKELLFMYQIHLKYLSSPISHYSAYAYVKENWIVCLKHCLLSLLIKWEIICLWNDFSRNTLELALTDHEWIYIYHLSLFLGKFLNLITPLL